MSLKFFINAEEIAKTIKEYANEVQKDIEKGVATLAAATQAKVVELAQSKLKLSRDKFLDNIRYEEISPGVHVISVLEDALFIEEGLPPGFDMKPGLLKSDKAKTTKDGNKYLVVPLKHDVPPSQSTPRAQDITTRIRQNLKKEGVPYKKLELNPDGSPKLGKLHSFNWGGKYPGEGNTKDLQRVNIYQTKTAAGVKRDIFTFRTVTSGPASANKWFHPGLEGKKFLDQALEWATSEWERTILPEIMKKWEGK